MGTIRLDDGGITYEQGITMLYIRFIRVQTKANSVDKKNQLDVTFCILYFSSNSCSTHSETCLYKTT